MQKLEEYTRALDISPAAPWQLQQLLVGREFSCSTVAHAGRVVAHADNEACLSCLYYRHIGVPQVPGPPCAWVCRKSWLACRGSVVDVSGTPSQ